MPTNVSKLVVRKASILMVPPGGGIGAAVNSIVTGRMSSAMREAQEWVKQALAMVRAASEPNPWKNADDETIAGDILKKIEEKDAADRRGLAMCVDLEKQMRAAQYRG